MITHPATGFSIGDPYSNPLKQIPGPDAARAFFDTLILSASGWRGVFGRHDEDAAEGITPAAAYVSARMALVFARYLKKASGKANPELALGIDSRPTGPAIADVMCRVFRSEGIQVRYGFICSAPEIMAWTAWTNEASATATPDGEAPVHPRLDGFCYISASHNPVGHNGVKFGLKDGGVLAPDVANQLVAQLRDGAASAEDIAHLAAGCAAAVPADIGRVYADCSRIKRLMVSAYTLFSRRVLAALPDNGPAGPDERQAEEQRLDNLELAVRQRGIGIVIDMNGSARSLSIDVDFFTGLGAEVRTINDRPRAFAHRIVPEGESLEQCRRTLEEAHRADPRFVFGYVPDCDGDRGNIVIWDDSRDEARALEAQETFALAVLAELASMEYYRAREGLTAGRIAVVGNDATSLRADRIAEAFGGRLFRAETGEANVVALARRLRGEGWTVRILGEGSNGGVITHPASVRDPLNTVGALLKLLALGAQDEADSPFRLWLKRSGQDSLQAETFSLADIAASLPAWQSTSVFESRAALRVRCRDQRSIKNHCLSLFEQAWPGLLAILEPVYGPCGYAVVISRGTSELEPGSDGDCGAGGLKFLVLDAAGQSQAFFWMRGSGTEPVFRIMVDAGGNRRDIEPILLERLTALVRQADAVLAEQ